MLLKPHNTGKPFIAALERSQRQGNFEHVERNLPKLRELIEQMQHDAYRLAQIQYRVRSVLLRHG